MKAWLTLRWLTAGLALHLAACDEAVTTQNDHNDTANAYASTYKPLRSEPTLIVGATILDGRGSQLNNASIFLQEGKVAAVGYNIHPLIPHRIIEGDGKWVTPGIIDVHSHIGGSPTPEVPAHEDGNERGDPNTADVWIEHTLWPQDPGFERASAGGVTVLQLMPGSSNLFGGRTVVLKNVPSRIGSDMKFPRARQGLKMACGENPKRNYRSKPGVYFSRPSTRMGSMAAYRQAFADAQVYSARRKAYRLEAKGLVPRRDIRMETLVAVLEGQIPVHVHCYRADDMANIMSVAKEFGFKVNSFQHAVESYKIADILAREEICSAMWADWYGFKMEAYDGIRENAAFVHKAGACAIIHSDSDYGIQRLNQETAKALADGLKAGVQISKAEAWQWISYNPARSLGIAAETGSLEIGKNADLVIWSGDPYSVYTLAEMTFVDGALIFDRTNNDRPPRSDFELGQAHTLN